MELNFENLPAPMGFTIDLEQLDTWEYLPDAEEHDDPTPTLAEVFNSDSISVIYIDMPSGTKLPWHTHEPHTSQLYWVLQGRLKTNYKDNTEERHSVEVGADEEKMVYLPAGAHNQLESTGEETLRALSFKSHGGTVNGRLEHLTGDTTEHYDPKSDPDPAALDILPRRGHVFNKNEDVVDDW